MTTKELLTNLEELGLHAEDDDFTITVWVLSGRHKNIKNKIAWINKECELNYKILSISHPKKKQLADIIHRYAQTTKSKRGRKTAYTQPAATKRYY